jgi:hypothetical protein
MQVTIVLAVLTVGLHWFGHVQRMEENRMLNLDTTRLRGRPRNRWQDEVRNDGRIVC